MNKQIQEIWTDLYLELKKYVFSKVKDKDASDDIVQDVFIKIYLNIDSLTDSSKLTSWVYQITRNTVADYFRKSKPGLSIDNFDIAEQESEEPLYQSLSNCINSKIQRLPEKYKQAILLTSFENHSQISLAEELNISYSGAKTRIQRAREQLKDLIIRCNNVETDSNGKITGYHPDENKQQKDG